MASFLKRVGGSYKRKTRRAFVGGMYKALGGSGSCPGKAFHQMEKKRKNERSNYWI